MKASHTLQGLRVAFDDPQLIANAGLLLPATLAHRLGLSQLVSEHVDLGDAPGAANAGSKALTMIAALLAGGDCMRGSSMWSAASSWLGPGERGQDPVTRRSPSTWIRRSARPTD